jgi:hypothetical protein
MGIWIKWLSEIQPLVLGCILIWAGAWKIGVSSASQAALKSALANIVSPRIAQLSHRFLGLIEFAVGWALLLPPNCKGEKFGVLALGLGFLLYLGLAKLLAPSRPCACMGSKEVPISWRSFGRAGLFFIMAALSGEAETFWLQALRGQPLLVVLAFAEFLLFLAFSPDIEWRWKKPLFSKNFIRIEDCAFAPEPLSKSLKLLKKSDAFKEFQPFIRGELIDYWREGCWRFFCFPACWDSLEAMAVFAVPIGGHPQQIRAVLVAGEETQVIKQYKVNA